jgi:hypothetical protein
MAGNKDTLEGGCTCRQVRYRMKGKPLFVHACHCTWCQRETGTVFATNAMIEADRVESIGQITPVLVDTPSASGKGQKIWRCPNCQVAVWSNYAGSGDKVRFIRVGTLDAGHGIKPDIHIFTSSRVPWLPLPPDAKAVPEFYKPKDTWPPETQARFAALKTK